jgi:hypothetical protein
MADRLDELYSKLQIDRWRIDHPFSDDMQECHATALNPLLNRAERTEGLSKWLVKYQPCLFGRMAVKAREISFCLLTEADVLRGDEHVRAVIQEARTVWQRRARNGQEHAFIVALVLRPLK